MISFLKRRPLIILLIAALIILCAFNFIILNFGFEGVIQTIVFKSLKSQLSSLLVLILILNCFLYPIYTLGFSILSMIILGNLTTLIFSSFIAGLIYVESKILSLLIALTSFWVLFVTYLLINVHL
jgi:hypothetical protein